MSYAFVLKSKVFLKYFIYPPLPRSEKQRDGERREELSNYKAPASPMFN